MNYLDKLDDIIKEVEESLNQKKADISSAKHPRTRNAYRRAGRYTIREFSLDEKKKDMNEEMSENSDDQANTNRLDSIQEQQTNTNGSNDLKTAQVESNNTKIPEKNKPILNLKIKETIEDTIFHFYSDPMSENMLETLDVSNSDAESTRSDTNHKSVKTKILPLRYAIIKRLKNRKRRTSPENVEDKRANSSPKFNHKSFNYFKYPENIEFKTHKSEKIYTHFPKICSTLYKTEKDYILLPKIIFKLCKTENIDDSPVGLQTHKEHEKNLNSEDYCKILFKKSNCMKFKKMHTIYKNRYLKTIEKMADSAYGEFEKLGGSILKYQEESKDNKLISENALKLLKETLTNDSLIFDNITNNFCKYCPSLSLKSRDKANAVKSLLQNKINVIDECLNEEQHNSNEKDLDVAPSEPPIQTEGTLPDIELFSGDKNLKSEVLMRFERIIINCLLSLRKSDVHDVVRKYTEFTAKKQDLRIIENTLNDKAFRNYLGLKVAKNIQASEIKMIIDRAEKYKDFVECVLKVLNKGNVEMDLRFIDMISRSIKKLQGSDDPFTCKMVVQAVLCRKYVEDSVELKKLFKKFSSLNI